MQRTPNARFGRSEIAVALCFLAAAGVSCRQDGAAQAQARPEAAQGQAATQPAGEIVLRLTQPSPKEKKFVVEVCNASSRNLALNKGFLLVEFLCELRGKSGPRPHYGPPTEPWIPTLKEFIVLKPNESTRIAFAMEDVAGPATHTTPDDPGPYLLVCRYQYTPEAAGEFGRAKDAETWFGTVESNALQVTVP